MQCMYQEVEGDNDDLFIVLYHRRRSILRDLEFLSTVDALFMNIDEDDIITRSNFFNRSRTLNLLTDSWAYANACFNVAQLTELHFWLQLPATFTISQHVHITITKIATGKTNVELIVMFSVAMDTFIC